MSYFHVGSYSMPRFYDDYKVAKKSFAEKLLPKALSAKINEKKLQKEIAEIEMLSVMPDFGPCKKIQKDELILGFNALVNNPQALYRYYTTPIDVGSGLSILALPIAKAADEETKIEMGRQIDILTSDLSTLSKSQKKKLRQLYFPMEQVIGVKKTTDLLA